MKYPLLALALLGCPAPSNIQPGPAPVERTAPAVGPQALGDVTHATGSNSIVAAGGFVFTANEDAGSVTRYEPTTGALQALDLGAEPTHLAAAGDDLYVTLRGERAVLKLSVARFDGVVARTEVGAEPLGVVVREDGSRVYVAVSQQDEVVELDADLTELARFPVVGEPRSVALHPSGVRLYVGLGRGVAGLASLDLISGQVAPITLPATTRQDRALGVRVTGDGTVTPDGTRLVVPVLYLDTLDPIPVFSSEQEVVDVPFGGDSPYGGKSEEVGKVTPALVELPVDAEGNAGIGTAIFVGAQGFEDFATPGMPFNGEDLGLGFGGTRAIGGTIDAVVSSVDGNRYLAAMDSAAVAMLVDPSIEVEGSVGIPFNDVAETDSDPGMDEEPDSGKVPRENGFRQVAVVPYAVGAGVSGVVFHDGGAFTNDTFAGTLSSLPLQDAEVRFEVAALNHFNEVGMIPPDRTVQVSTSTLPEQIQLGRSLFFSTRNAGMSAGGVSCSACHTDGRTDGVTWTFADGPRQTPSLAGRVSDTEPVTWRSDVVSVREEAAITTRGRMGGFGVSPEELDALAAYIDWTRLPDTRDQGALNASVLNGMALYQRAGCASCHSGDAFTDDQSWTVRGVTDLNTPSLRGIAATAPYLHDGSAATLRDVLLQLGQTGEMGNTAGFSPTELDDLVAYLQTL